MDERFSERNVDTQLYRLAFEASSSPKIIADREGKIVRVNIQAEKLFGYEKDALVGQPVEVLVPERFRKNHLQYRKSFVEQPRTRPMGAGRDLFGLRKDGSEFPIEIGLTPVKIGESFFILSSIVDLTERKKAEREREHMLELETSAREEAETTNRMKDEFLAVISHELRTPLQSILGWSGMLRSGMLDSERQRHALQVIERSARTQAKLVEDILDMSGLIIGKLKLNTRPVDLTSVIQSAVSNLQPSIKDKNIKIKVDMDSRASLVSGDEDRLQQVVWNLISNAVKFSPQNGTVEIHLAVAGANAAIVVSDYGEGIHPDFLPHVFERFRQADSSHTRIHGGLGLGLAIVRHLVELHGGTVEATSKGLSRGATFTVRLPVLPSQDTGARKPSSADSSRIFSSESLRGKAVVVVDDDFSTREIVSVILGLRGMRVYTADSAAEGLAITRKVKPDFIISDLEMPGEDGFSFIRKVRAGEEIRVPAIALTAHAQSDVRVRAMLEGFDIHVSKPVEPQELVSILVEVEAKNRSANGR